MNAANSEAHASIESLRDQLIPSECPKDSNLMAINSEFNHFLLDKLAIQLAERNELYQTVIKNSFASQEQKQAVDVDTFKMKLKLKAKDAEIETVGVLSTLCALSDLNTGSKIVKKKNHFHLVNGEKDFALGPAQIKLLKHYGLDNVLSENSEQSSLNGEKGKDRVYLKVEQFSEDFQTAASALKKEHGRSKEVESIHSM